MNRGGVGARALNLEAMNPAGERKGRTIRLDLRAQRPRQCSKAFHDRDERR
jgi:hypothetical protein